MVFVRDELVLGPDDFEEFRKGLGKTWVNQYDEGLAEMQAFNFSRITRRVLDTLVLHIDFDNLITISAEEIAATLQMSQPNVSRAFKFLRERWIIYPIQKKDKNIAYVFNPRYYWRGAEDKRMARLKELDNLNLVANVRAAREAGLEAC